MTGLPKKTILAVDDARGNLDVVKAILAPTYTVKAAISGKMALKIVEKQKPDLILLDGSASIASARWAISSASLRSKPAPVASPISREVFGR